MADQVINIAKGRVVEYYNRVKGNDPAASIFTLVLLKAAQADSFLIDYADLDALLTNASNTEADFTNYARKFLADTDIDPLPAPDNTNDRFDIDLPDQTFTNAGGAINNTLVKAIICYDADGSGSGTDANIIPLCHYDFAATTDGSDLTLIWNSAGFFRAS